MLLRVLRVAAGWMVGWALLGATLSIVVGYIDPPAIDAGEGPIDLARIVGTVGGACGLAFGVLVATMERGKELAEVGWLRALAWSGIAGLTMPLALGENPQVLTNTIPFAAISGALSLAIARGIRRRRAAAPA